MTYPTGLAFSPDGTNMFVVGIRQRQGRIPVCAISAPWNITTASYDGPATPTTSSIPGLQLPEDVAFSAGRFPSMFVAGSGPRQAYTSTRLWPPPGTSPPPPIPTTSHDVSIPGDPFPTGLAFSPDGTNMFVVGTANDKVHRYSLSAPWDVTSASYDTGDSRDVRSQEAAPTDVAFSADGARMFVVGGAIDMVYQYELHTVFPITTSLDTVPIELVSAEYASPTLTITFSEDIDRRHRLHQDAHTGYGGDRRAASQSADISTKSLSGDTITATIVP